jgi:cytochrome oxidase Cu insertion factor (SCO1/SenC/PrrC family)
MNRYLFVTLIIVIMLVLAGCASVAEPTLLPSLVGSTAPDFSLDNALGGKTSLSDYDGTPVLLFFHMAVG